MANTPIVSCKTTNSLTGYSYHCGISLWIIFWSGPGNEVYDPPSLISLLFTMMSSSVTMTSLWDNTIVCSGPGNEAYDPPAAVGTLRRYGQDTYTTSVTKTTGNHGDTFTCTASNGASMSTRNYTLSSALPPSNVTWEQIAPSVIKVRPKKKLNSTAQRIQLMRSIFSNVSNIAIYCLIFLNIAIIKSTHSL